ncbi:MAG: hypothetical protein IJ038_04930 [Clostridia bacterium]|nr:hypothetical protein [Clostridia bacterium]
MAEERAVVGGKYLEYRGKPLVREGDTICYGDMTDKYVLILEIMSYKEVDGTSVPDDIFIQIINPQNSGDIKNQGSKKGFYDALGIGLVWLDRALM